MTIVAIEPVFDEAFELDETEPVHLVCHCTKDAVAACGLDVTFEPWEEYALEELECPLCLLVWPDGAPTCPWGCACEECVG